MSVAGYFGPELSEAGLPEKHEQDERALTRAMKPDRLDGEPLPGGVKRAGHQDRVHKNVADYDPVLRSHCRLP